MRLWRVDRRKKRLLPARTVALAAPADSDSDSDDSSEKMTPHKRALIESSFEVGKAGVWPNAKLNVVQAPGFVNGLAFAPDGSFVVCFLFYCFFG